MPTSEELKFILKMRDEASAILKRTGQSIGDTGDQAKRASKSFDTMAKAATAAGAALAGAFASNQAIRSTLTAFSQYERGLLNVRKTTNMTVTDMAAFRDEFDAMTSTMDGVTVQGMLDIAGAAGQLGVQGTSNIIEFTKVMGELEVASDVVGAAGAASIARLLTITKEGIRGADSFTDTLVALGNTTAATESEILRLSSRVAQATAQFGMGSTAILGISAAAAQLDLRPEMFGTGMGRVMQELNDAALNATGGMARLTEITGLSREEFQKMIKESPENALLVFLQVLKEMRDEGMSLTSFLSDFNITGVEMTSILGSMSQNIDLVRGKLVEANKATEESSARTKEFGIFAEGLGAQWAGLASSAYNAIVAIGDALKPVAVGIIAPLRVAINGLTDAFQALPSTMQTIVATAAVLAPSFAGIAVAVRLLLPALKLFGAGTLLSGLTGSVKGLTPLIAGMRRSFISAIAGAVMLGKTSKVMTATTGQAITGLIGVIKGIGPAMKAGGVAAAAMTTRAGAAFKALGATIIATSGQVVAFVRGFSIMGAAASAVGLVTKAFTTLRLAIIAIPATIAAIPAILASLPVLFVASITAAMVAIGVLIYAKWDEIVAFLSQSWGEMGADIYNAVAGGFGRAVDYVKGLWSDFMGWFGDETTKSIASGAPEAGKVWGDSMVSSATDAVKNGAGNIIDPLKDLNIGEGLTGLSADTLADLFNPKEARREIEKQKAALEELMTLSPKARIDAGFLPQDVARLKAMIDQAEREMDPIAVAIEDLGFEIEAAKAVTKEKQNELAIREKIRDLSRDAGELDAAAKKQITDRMRELQRIEKDASYDEWVRDLTQGLQLAKAVTADRQLELEIMQAIAGKEREIGTLTAARKEEIANLIRATEQASNFDSLSRALDPVGDAIRQYEADLQTLNRALANGTIDAQRYGQMLEELNRISLDARNPIAARVRDMREEVALMRLSGRERDVEARYLREINDLKRQGVPITNGLSSAVRDYAQSLSDADFAGQNGVQGWIDSVGTFEEGIASLQEDAIGGLADAITGLFNGTENSFRNFAVNLGKSMVRFAVNQTLKNAMESLMPNKEQSALDRADQALARIEALSTSGLNTPQVIVNAGSAILNGQPLGGQPTGAPANDNAAAPGNAGLRGSLGIDSRTTGSIASSTRGAMAQIDEAVASKVGSAVDLASSYMGQTESGNTASINSFLKKGGVDINAAQTAWCAGFVNSSLEQVGIDGSGSLVANSFRQWGQAVNPEEAMRGDVLVQHRNKGMGTGGHVGFATGNMRMDGERMLLEMLSGNSADKVRKTWHDASELDVRRSSEGAIDPQITGTIQQANTALKQTGQTMQAMGPQTQILRTNIQQTGVQSQTAGMQMRNAGTQINMAGVNAMTTGPQFQQAGTQIQQAGLAAQQAGNSAKQAGPGFSGMQQGLQGILPALDQVVPGLGSFASSILNFLGSLGKGGAGGAGGAAGGGGGIGGIFSTVMGFFLHDGGKVGSSKPTKTRVMPAAAWAGAPKFHNGLKSDEYTAVLQRGERVLTEKNESEAMNTVRGLTSQLAEARSQNRVQSTAPASGRGQVINMVVNAKDVNSFRKSQGQLSAEAAIEFRRMGARNN